MPVFRRLVPSSTIRLSILAGLVAGVLSYAGHNLQAQQTTAPSQSDHPTRPIHDAAISDLTALVKKINNSQPQWGLIRDEQGLFADRSPFSFPEIKGAAAQFDDACSDYLELDRRWGFTPEEFGRLLLPALGDRDRFVVAHVLLSHLFPKKGKATVTEQQDGSFIEVLDGLTIRLQVEGEGNDGGRSGDTLYICRAQVDPGQAKRVKQHWVDRLR